MTEHVYVPYDQLTSDALEALLEEFITREGTDYGLHEHSLAQKKDSVRAQLMRGDVVIVFDPRAESVTLIPKRDLSRAREAEL